MFTGVNGTSGAGPIQRSSSNSELHTQAANEAVAYLKKGLKQYTSAGDLDPGQWGSPSGSRSDSEGWTNVSPTGVSELHLTPVKGSGCGELSDPNIGIGTLKKELFALPNTEITTNKTTRLRELQAAFTEKLTAGINLPTTADSGQWQTAANALRELNDAFVGLYRPEEAGYEGTKAAFTNLATGVMARYRQLAGAGLQTNRNPPINGTHDDKLTEIDRRLAAHSSHQTEFNRMFAAGEGPMGDVRTEQNGAIQRPIDALLTLKVEVADHKLNAATATLKGALQTLYIVLGTDQKNAFTDQENDFKDTKEATERKKAASVSIRTDEGQNTRANDTSVAADTLSAQSIAIQNLVYAFTFAKQQIAGAIHNTTSDIANSKTSEVTKDELAAKQNVLEDALTAALDRFVTTTSHSSDAAVAGIRATLEKNAEDALRDGIRAIHDFAASGIKDRQLGETNADRLAYLQTQEKRLGRFLPDDIRAEAKRLLESENARLAAEQSDAARAAKASTLRDISKSKDELGPIRESLDDIRSRRPADEVRDNAAITDVLGDRLRELPDLHQGSSELEIDAYQTAIGLYREGMMTELDILKTAQTQDLSQLAKLMGIYDGVVRQYNTEVSIPHTPSANFQNHSNALHTQGEKPQAETMSELSTTIRADIHAIKQSRTEKSEALETANRQFATATTDLEAKLRVFYTAIVSDDTAAAVATAKATAAKTSANVDGDPHIDVQTTRMNEARGVITAETKAIGQLTGHYGTAQKAIATAVREEWAKPGLQTKFDTVLAKFDTQTSVLPDAERAAARQSLQTTIATQLSASAAAAAREKNRIAAEAAEMLIATQRLDTATQGIRAEYAGAPDQDTLVTAELTAAQGKITDRFGDGPATSASTTAKAEILETRLAEIKEAKKAEALAEAQALMATALQGVSDATAELGDRLSEWANVAGLDVPTAEMIVTDMMKTLFPGRSEKSLSPEELDALRQNIGLRSAAYQDITYAANGVVNAYEALDLAHAVIAVAIYEAAVVPTNPEKRIIATEKLHTVAETLRSKTLEITAATAASRIRTSDLEKLDTLKTQLGKVLGIPTDTMTARSALLQKAVVLLGTISTETERLFPDNISKEDRVAHTALRDLSTKVQTTYSRFCTMDSRDLLSQSTGTLGSVGTASSRVLDDIATGLRSGHTARRNEFETAYTIEGLSSAPLDAGLATLDGFEAQLSGAVAGRRGQINSIRQAYVEANNQLEAAFGDAQRGIDFKTTTASELNAKTRAFTTACEAAERGMNMALRNIPPDEDPPQVFGSAVTTAHKKLNAAFTTGVSTILHSNIRAFGDLIADVAIYTDPAENISNYTKSALRLRASATDLRYFMTAGLRDEINTITQRHFDQVLDTANEAATQAIARATAALTYGIDPDTIGKEDLTSRMQQFQTALSDVLETFEAAVESLPVNTTITETLSGLTTSVRASGPIAQKALMTLVSTPLETQRKSIATLLTREGGVTLADLNDVQGQVHRLDQRSAELGKAWVSNMAEINQTLNAYDAKLGILKATRNSQISVFTAAMNKLTFIPNDMNLDDKWSAIRDHEGQFEELKKDYAHLFEEETVDTRVTEAKTAGIERATAARENLAPETDAILSAILALLTTLPADFDWDITMDSLANGISADTEIRNALKAAGQAIPGLEAAIRDRLSSRETVEKAKAALVAWRPGQPFDTVPTHQVNVLFLEFPEVPFDATAFDANLAVQTSGITTHFTAIHTLATPIRSDSLNNRWGDIQGQEQALVSLQTLDPFNKNVSLQSQISAISTHLDGYAVPSDLERALFIQRLQDVLGSRSLTPDQIRKEAQNNAQSQINNPKFQRAIQACHDGSSTLNVPIQERITYRQTLNTAEVLVGRMAGPEQTIGELTPTLSNLEGTPEAHTDFTSYDTYQKPRVDAAKVSITARITELKEHTRRLTEAVDTANTALDTARRTAETLTPTQVGTETADTLNTRMTALDRDANAALAAFDTAVAGLPDNQARRDARIALEFRTWTLDGATKTQLQNSVSAPLQTIKNEINGLLGRMGTTQADLENNAIVVENLEARLNALGDTWLTAGLGDEICTTIKAYESRLDAMRTRTGQIQTLTDALNGLNFAVPANATFADKWNKIGENDNSQIALREHSDFLSLFNEEPKDRAITDALTELEARRTAAIEDRVPEQRALIAGLADQLGGLTTAGFDWDATLTTAETAARNTLPVDLQTNVEMQVALATAKRDLNGLKNAVTTRVTAREDLDTATASLTGWPDSGRSLNDIRTEVTTARTTFGNKAATVLLTEWDLATEARVTTLERGLEESILRRDTLIAQFQAITTMAVRTDTLANRWTDIAAKETRLATLQTTTANISIMVDPQVAAKIAEVQGVLNGHNTPTDLERAAFTEGMNIALANPALMTADAVLDRAAASVTAGLPLDSPTLIRFQTAIATLQTSAATHLTAHINSRLDYRGRITTAAEVFAAVQDRTATTLQLQTAIGTIGAVPVIVDPGDGTNIFATADAAMATQKDTVERGLVTHRALVTAFTDAITTATGQLPDRTTPPPITAEAKWTALNTASATYDSALAHADYLFDSEAPLGSPNFHPDITTTNDVFNTQWGVLKDNVTPEAAAIRRNAADCLVAFIQGTALLTPAPTFEASQTAVLNGLGIPAEFRVSVETALGGLGIRAEIQSRLAVHAALQNLKADGSLPIAKKTAIDEAKALFQNRPLNPAYAACDAILSDRLQALQRGVYGVLAEETAQAMLVNATTLHITEAKEAGTTSSLIKMGELWQNLESEFRNPAKGPGWKYHVSLDDAFQGVLDPSTPPKDTDEFIGFLRTAIERLNLQAGPTGLPDPYKRIAETALQRLAGRNTGTPQLCAWAMSANLRLVMSVIENFGDTRAARVSGIGMDDNYISLHEGITLRQGDAGSITGYSREHGALWSQLHQRPIDFLPIEIVTADNIPGSMLSADDIAALIEKMGMGDRVSIVGYVPAAGGQEATLTQEGWNSFCAILGADATISAFLEARWTVSADPILLSELHSRLEYLLKTEAEYKHLRYLFGRKLERVYQELVLESRV